MGRERHKPGDNIGTGRIGGGVPNNKGSDQRIGARSRLVLSLNQAEAGQGNQTCKQNTRNGGKMISVDFHK